jgi:hypothetical protein
MSATNGIMCPDCNQEKALEQFERGRKICRDCRNTQRRKGNRKVCDICNTEKENNFFRKTSSVCKDCEEKVGKKCSICEEIKDRTQYYGLSAFCKSCTKKKKEDRSDETKICEQCTNKKLLKEFRGATSKVCLACEDVLVLTKKCRDCLEEKPFSAFRPNRRQCHECEKADGRQYRRTTTKAKEWAEQNKERFAKLQKDNYEKNKIQIRATERERKKEDPDFAKVRKYKNCLNKFIRVGVKPSVDLQIGKSDYISWLSFSFKEEMCMENYATLWCIDHVIPLALLYEKKSRTNLEKIYDSFPDLEDLLFCWYNTNPLRKEENRQKGHKIDIEILKNHLVQIKRFFKVSPQTIKKDALFYRYKKLLRDIIDILYE